MSPRGTSERPSRGPDGLPRAIFGKRNRKIVFCCKPAFSLRKTILLEGPGCLWGAFWGHFLTNLSEQMALRGPSWRQDGRKVAHKCTKCALKAILGPKLFIWGASGVDPRTARLAKGGVRGGTVNYLQIFKEDICRFQELCRYLLEKHLQRYL